MAWRNCRNKCDGFRASLALLLGSEHCEACITTTQIGSPSEGQVEKDRKKLFVCLVILPFSSRRLFGTIAMLESSPSPKWVAAPKLSLLPEKSAPTQRSKEGGKGELTRALAITSAVIFKGEARKMALAANSARPHSNSASTSILHVPQVKSCRTTPSSAPCSLPNIVEQLRSQPWARRPVSNQGFRGREKTESPLHARRSLNRPSTRPILQV